MTEIVILGAGYTGMAAALGVARRTRRREDEPQNVQQLTQR